MSIAPDAIAAIGLPDARRTRYSDAEIGWMMKCKARQMIDDGEIKTEEDAMQRFKIRGEWIAAQNDVAEDVREYWLKFELKFFYSARKYLAEIREMESSCK